MSFITVYTFVTKSQHIFTFCFWLRSGGFASLHPLSNCYRIHLHRGTIVFYFFLYPHVPCTTWYETVSVH